MPLRQGNVRPRGAPVVTAAQRQHHVPRIQVLGSEGGRRLFCDALMASFDSVSVEKWSMKSSLAPTKAAKQCACASPPPSHAW